jgi:hypothetical protein
MSSADYNDVPMTRMRLSLPVVKTANIVGSAKRRGHQEMSPVQENVRHGGDVKMTSATNNNNIVKLLNDLFFRLEILRNDRELLRLVVK